MPLLNPPPNTIVETIKGAEDGNGIVVRLYECNRQRGWVTLRVGFPVKEAYATNLLEENQEALEVDGQKIRFYLKPFQIITIRLVPS